MADHECKVHRERVPHEGSDVYVERCNVCGKLRREKPGGRPMAWMRTPPGSGWPWIYAYADEPMQLRNDAHIWVWE